MSPRMELHVRAHPPHKLPSVTRGILDLLQVELFLNAASTISRKRQRFKKKGSWVTTTWERNAIRSGRNVKSEGKDGARVHSTTIMAVVLEIRRRNSYDNYGCILQNTDEVQKAKVFVSHPGPQSDVSISYAGINRWHIQGQKALKIKDLFSMEVKLQWKTNKINLRSSGRNRMFTLMTISLYVHEFFNRCWYKQNFSIYILTY